jgi:hypothetical protein
MTRVSFTTRQSPVRRSRPRVRHPGVAKGARSPVEDQKARSVAALRGLLRDAIRRQREVVLRQLAGGVDRR